MSRPSRFPFKTSVVTGLLCYLVVQNPPFSVRFARADDLDAYRCEFYPLSSFPMYSGFDDSELHVFVTDAQDQPIRLHDLPNCQASALKKNYKGGLVELKKKSGRKGRVIDLPLDLKQKAGAFVLHDILTSRARSWADQNPQKVLRLHEGLILQEDGKIIRRTQVVAEGSLETLRNYQPEVHGESRD